MLMRCVADNHLDLSLNKPCAVLNAFSTSAEVAASSVAISVSSKGAVTVILSLSIFLISVIING